MAGGPIIGVDNVFAITAGSVVQFLLRDITGPGLSRASVDTSSQASADIDGVAAVVQTFAPGLIDPGEITLSLIFQPDETPPMLTEAHPTAMTIAWADGSIWSFSGIVTGWSPSAPYGDLATCDCTVKVSGTIGVA